MNWRFIVSSINFNYFNSFIQQYLLFTYYFTYILLSVSLSNNPESFSTAIKPLIARMNKQGVSVEKINSVILKFFNKHQGDFNNVCQYKQELLHLVPYIINRFSFYSFRPTNNVGCYRYADKTAMPVFCKYKLKAITNNENKNKKLKNKKINK